MQNEKQIYLKNPFEYAHPKDGIVKAQFVTLFAPSFADFDKVAPLRQAFMQALNEFRKRNPPKETTATSTATEQDADAGLPPEFIVTILESSTTVNMVQVGQMFSDILMKTKLVLIDGETRYTETLVKKMGIPNFLFLLGEYYSTFILASLTL
jgi:hypothetical protein